MTKIQSICVYCGSGTGTNPRYEEAARAFGEMLAKNDIRLVFGGGKFGLMGVLAETVMEHGGKVTGIIPKFLLDREGENSTLSELIVTENMHERKQLMFEKSDAFVALPGGIGTLEEIVEMMTWAQLARHKKPIVLASIDNFWEPLEALLAHMREEAFIRKGLEVTYKITGNPADILDLLNAQTG